MNVDRFRNVEFVKSHAMKTIDFYAPICLDEKVGGFYGGYLDDGTIYDNETKDLIGTTRFILNFSFGNLLSNSNKYSKFIDHGLKFLNGAHKDKVNGGFHQILKNRKPIIANKTTYGHAFVLCAVSNAYKAGIKEAKEMIGQVYNLLEDKLWREDEGLYVDECTNDFRTVVPYRGQNSNMHITEAMLTAYEATQEKVYLEKARNLAYRITVELAKQCGNMIWEHYTTDWKIDPGYNKNLNKGDTEYLYKPYGFLPGHFVEWSKLLLILERHKPEPWQLKTAEDLFEKAMKYGWDGGYGGQNYTFDFGGNVLNTDRYYWSHAESIVASCLLAERTSEDKYWGWYNKFWDYSLKNLADEKYGGWYRRVTREGKRLSDKKSIPGKTDYHVIGACYEIIRTLSNNANYR